MSFCSIMNGRDRILATLKGEQADRVPVAPFVQEEYLLYIYKDKKTIDRVYDAAILAEELGFDLMARHKRYEKPDYFRCSYPGWEVDTGQTTTNGLVYRTTIIKTPARVLKSMEVGPECGGAVSGIHFSTTEYLLKDRQDIEAFIEYLPVLSGETIDDMRASAVEWAKVIGDTGIAAPWGWGGVYNCAAECRNVEALMMDAYLEPELYAALMSRIAEAQAEYNAALARAGMPCVGFQGNIANGAMVGGDFFRQHIQPFEQISIDAVKREGAFVLYHNCGYAQALYGNYAEMGLDVWETVAAPPQGDNDLARAKELIGDKLCLMGNIDQVSFLKQASPGEIALQTEEIVNTGKPGGRYIFAASDFLEAGTPLENVRAMIDAAITAGKY